MKRLTSLIALCFVLCFASLWFSPLNSLAEDFFRWTDASGKAVYGSNPPKNATGVTSAKGGAFSRYSSKKMLRGFPAPITTPHGAREERQEEIKETNLIVTNDPMDPSGTKGQVQGVSLEHGEPKILRNETQQVIGCEVMVKNPSNQTAKNVVVTLRFRDGTVIQAHGPNELHGMEEVLYSVPEGQLQISLPTVPTLSVPTLSVKDSFEIPEDLETPKQVSDVEILVVFNS